MNDCKSNICSYATFYISKFIIQQTPKQWLQIGTINLILMT